MTPADLLRYNTCMSGVVTLENAIKALDPSPEERVLLERAWAAKGRARNNVVMLVRSRGLRLLVEGPPGSGKTTACQRLAASLSGGLDVVDVDQDRSDAGSDSWRTWAVSLPGVFLPEGASGVGGLRSASQRAYDAAWESLVRRTSDVSAELRAGRSSGVVLDTATSLVTYHADTASAASVDFGADEDKDEKMATERYRGAIYKAAAAVSGQVWALATEGVWTAPPGPVVGLALAHAKPVTDPKSREFRGWTISLGPQSANEIRGRADFVVCCGMDPSDKPGAVRLRYYAKVEESATGGAKARWSEIETPKGRVTDKDERDPAVKALADGIDLGTFVRGIVAHRRKLGFERLARVVAALDAGAAS